MRVAFVSSEVSPFSKTGGLADVSQALPAALAALGHEVVVFSPLYRGAVAALARLQLRTEDESGPTLWIGDEQHPVHYRSVQRDGCRYVFVADDAFYDRATLYVDATGADYGDNAARFAYLCRAALEYWLGHGQAPDIFHLNDWPTALIAVYLHTLYRHPLLAAARSVFTVHNLAYQGRFAPPQLYATGLDWSVFHPGALEYYGVLNWMKGALIFADALTTVSPTYAEEIQRPEFGHGFDGLLRDLRGKLTGILNGIDTALWNPAADRLLPATFTAEDLRGKAACKRALQQRLGLPPRDDAFLLGAISRFDGQKGIPLIADATRSVAPLPVQLAVLGYGDVGLEQRMRWHAGSYPQQVAVTIGFDEALAHLIEAGADAFLMPSAYEPSGLSQMYSQRYGTVPIVHATGGLRDTVMDYTPARLATGTASGFAFDIFDAAHLAEAVLRAWRLYAHAADEWQRLQRQCMALDHSWVKSARQYVELYEQLTGGRT